MANNPAGNRSNASDAGKARASPKGDTLWDDVIALKRDRILEGAATLFFKRGYRQTTVDAIAEHLGATKPFVYYHFKSKIDLLVEICERATSDTLAATESAMSAEGSPKVRLAQFVWAFANVALERHQFVAIYFREELNLPAEVAERIHVMRRSLDHRLRALLSEGMVSGDFEIEDPRMCALFIDGMSTYAFAWYREGGRLDQQEVADQIVEMVMKMVSAPSS